MVKVRRIDEQTPEQQLEKLCRACSQPFAPKAPNAKFCHDPECVKHRHVIRQMDFYRRHHKRANSSPKGGRPRTVAPENRSYQLEHYYKKKAGQVDSLEDKLKDI